MLMAGEEAAVRVVAIKAERSVAVRADPDRVWQLLQTPAIWSLKAKAFTFAVPGLHLHRLENGALKSQAVAVPAVTDGLGAVTHRLRTPYDRTRYGISAGADRAELEMTWTGPPGPDGANREAVALSLRATLSHYKAALEGTAEPAG
jgi:hypothetical protein